MATARNPYAAGNNGSVSRFAAVTKSDSADFAGGVARGLYVGVSGDVAVVGVDDTAVTFKALAVGYHPLVCKRVNSTATTATDIVALFD